MVSFGPPHPVLGPTPRRVADFAIIFEAMTNARFLCLLSAFALVAAAPVKLEVTSKLGTKFYSLTDEKGVVEAAAQNLAADPKSPKLLLQLAQAQVSVWEDKEAVKTLTLALAISPDNADLYTERGHRELPLRDFRQARADLSRAAALNPKIMAAYYHVGLAHFFLGEFGEAADAFRHAVETAPNGDERINSTNWLCAALFRAGRKDEAAKALDAIPPEMTNQEAHTRFYLNLVRFFQGRMSESEAVPPEPPAGNTDQEVELPFDTVAFGVGNWHLAKGDTAKAQEYFQRILKGRVWVTWGFVGAETELARVGVHGK